MTADMSWTYTPQPNTLPSDAGLPTQARFAARAASEYEMHGHAPAKSQDAWVFNAEATSTLLIAGWFVFGVFLALGLLPGGEAGAGSGGEASAGAAGTDAWSLEAFFHWGDAWVIPLLLGVFYLGAGYLYQRYQHVDDVRSKAAYLKREAIVLLTPFLAFTLLTLLTSSVVSTTPGLLASHVLSAGPTFDGPQLLYALFVQPTGPVGYFIVLLAFFIVTRTPRTDAGALALLAAAFAAKLLACTLANAQAAGALPASLFPDGAVPYYAQQLLDNWLWFVLGICLQRFNVQPRLARPVVAVACAAGFAVLAGALFATRTTDAFALAGLTLLGLAAFYSVSGARFLTGAQNRFFGFVTRYTMAIWLMHHLLCALAFCLLWLAGFSPDGAFAAVWRPVFGVTCLVACYVLPVAVMQLLSRVGKLGFIVYPARYLPDKL